MFNKIKSSSFGSHTKGGPEALKFEFNVQVKSMDKLPTKYKHLRVSLTKGGKAASTKEIFAVNQHAEPSPSDGTMKMVTTMYRGTPGSAGVSAAGFEEKTYKLSLMRINPRAMREREKKIGSSYINLSEYASLEQSGVGEDLKITMKVSESSDPTVIMLHIKSAWLKNYKGGDDTSSDISGMNLETASQATSHNSLNSIDEEEEEEATPDKLRVPQSIPETGETPVSLRREPSIKSPARSDSSRSATASPAVGGASFAEVKELKHKLSAAQADLEWTQETVKDLESALSAKEKELQTVQEKCKKLQGEMEGAQRVQEELMQENERAERQYETLLQQVEKNKKGSAAPSASGGGADPQVATLKSEIDELKRDALALREERDKLKRELGREKDARVAAEERLEAEKKKIDKSRSGEEVPEGKKVAELEAALERERGKAAQYKGWLAKMTETKGAVESELAALKAGDQAPSGKGKRESKGGGAEEELRKMGDELERVSMQLVTASLGHAQAEQDRLEVKQQVYRLKDANRKLRERLTAVELELAQAKNV